MHILDVATFIADANRGLGLVFARTALKLGAKKVYAAARDSACVLLLPGVYAARKEVTRLEDDTAAAEGCRDVNVAFNKVGVSRNSSELAAGGLEFVTNFHGPWRISQAFAPVVLAQGSAAIVKVLSVLSWPNFPGGSTDALSNDLTGQRARVHDLEVGFKDTDLKVSLNTRKDSPCDMAQQTLFAMSAGHEEVLADATRRAAKRGLSAGLGIYPQPAASRSLS
jgi:NAD(P)-dependent dehydrogenase (short-subunit alcohol dehydrogenase family)